MLLTFILGPAHADLLSNVLKDVMTSEQRDTFWRYFNKLTILIGVSIPGHMGYPLYFFIFYPHAQSGVIVDILLCQLVPVARCLGSLLIVVV